MHTLPQGSTKFSTVFRDAVSDAMIEALGISGARAIRYYIGPVDYDDVKDLHTRLKALLGPGALALENVIIRQLALLLGLPVFRLKPDDIVKSASLARGMQKAKQGG